MLNTALHEFQSLSCGSTRSRYGARDPAGCTRTVDCRELAPSGALARRDILAARMRVWHGFGAIVSAAIVMTGGWPSPASAEKIEAALARAYQNNPQLNAQRATVRQTDEGVPQALSGYRPSISANASAANQSGARRICP